jgi:hypothetical protein
MRLLSLQREIRSPLPASVASDQLHALYASYVQNLSTIFRQTQGTGNLYYTFVLLAKHRPARCGFRKYTETSGVEQMILTLLRSVPHEYLR